MRIFAFMVAVSIAGLAPPAIGQPTDADELNRQSVPAPATTTTVLSADPGVPDKIVTKFPGNADAVPPTDVKVYPVCTAKLQDSCQNRGEGGAPGRSRALPYWPGRPASEQ